MQAIITKYLPATNHRPARIKASCQRGSRIVSWDYAFDVEGNHRLAANKLLGRFMSEDVKTHGSDPKTNPWARNFVSGELPSGEYAHVFTH